MYIDYNENIQEIIKEYKNAIDKYLDTVLPYEKSMPNKLHEAIRYSVFAGGKRIRPIVTMLCCKMLSGNMDDVLPVAAAIEMIHTYSLIHDDLPAMDNDDFRRGKPSCHKQFGEAIAILAGDALQSKAFEILARAPKTTSIKPDYANLIIECVALAAGNAGMVGGQAMDILSNTALNTEKNISELLLYEIHKRKTAALISAAAKTGAFVARAKISEVNLVEDFGSALGLLFQISDDIMDSTSTMQELGKTPGKDKKDNKLTFVSLFGMDNARKKMSEFLLRTKALLDGFGDKATPLRNLADLLAARVK